VNVTNRCNLSCGHCFVYRDANPNVPTRSGLERSDDDVLAVLEALRERHRLRTVLWMGGEPMLRRSLIRRGVALFHANSVATNGTLPLLDLGPDALYVVSLDGPPALNDEIRGAGSFARVVENLEHLPEGFATRLQAQCTVTRANQDHLDELVEELVDSRFEWMTFSFYVPGANDSSPHAWPTLEDRMVAVDAVRRVKQRHPHFVRNRSRALELMAPELAPAVTSTCPARSLILPLYLDRDRFVTPYCCYGNDVDCDRCGAWVVFETAALLDGGHPES
jgi:MoaA/NifB/PqqE/SkfB family radical SAM enzyme